MTSRKQRGSHRQDDYPHGRLSDVQDNIRTKDRQFYEKGQSAKKLEEIQKTNRKESTY